MTRRGHLALLVAAGLAVPAALGFAQDARRSGFDDMSRETQAMQRDDTQNPGMLWAADGEALWTAKPTASGGRSCADCHGAAESLRGVAARYPAPDDATGRVVDLQGRINLCRERHQDAAAFPPESHDLLALASFVGLQSRGLPIAPADDPRMTPVRTRGQALFTTRLGQLDLSCAQCHDDHAGGRLGSAPIPQAHPTGYPLYRLEWQTVGSLQRRLRGCMTGVRAEPFGYGSEEFVALEAFLAWRAKGMLVETPAVRP